MKIQVQYGRDSHTSTINRGTGRGIEIALRKDGWSTTDQVQYADSSCIVLDGVVWYPPNRTIEKESKTFPKGME